MKHLLLIGSQLGVLNLLLNKLEVLRPNGYNLCVFLRAKKQLLLLEFRWQSHSDKVNRLQKTKALVGEAHLDQRISEVVNIIRHYSSFGMHLRRWLVTGWYKKNISSPKMIVKF